MNLAAYDIIMGEEQLKSWINKPTKQLRSRVIPFYSYYYLSKRYDSSYKTYDYYIILTNEKYDDPEPRYANRTRGGIIKFNIKEIIKDLNLGKGENIPINLELYDEQEDCIIYKINV